jgi:AcrR family transcriptional regulator
MPSRSARGGRPRDTHIDAAVLDAALEELERSGYRGFSLEAVARSAGTSRPAVYRRWPGRQQLVLAALARRLGEAQVPESECTMCDLVECINVFVTAFERLPPDVLGPLLADCAAHPELRTAFMATLFEPPRVAVKQTLARAVARGDLRADVDLELTVDLLGSLVHYRALFGHAPTTEAEIERAVETLLAGIATDFPTLLEHSRQLAASTPAHQLHT